MDNRSHKVKPARLSDGSRFGQASEQLRGSTVCCLAHSFTGSQVHRRLRMVGKDLFYSQVVLPTRHIPSRALSKTMLEPDRSKSHPCGS